MIAVLLFGIRVSRVLEDGKWELTRQELNCFSTSSHFLNPSPFWHDSDTLLTSGTARLSKEAPAGWDHSTALGLQVWRDVFSPYWGLCLHHRQCLHKLPDSRNGNYDSERAEIRVGSTFATPFPEAGIKSWRGMMQPALSRRLSVAGGLVSEALIQWKKQVRNLVEASFRYVLISLSNSFKASCSVHVMYME